MIPSFDMNQMIAFGNVYKWVKSFFNVFKKILTDIFEKVLFSLFDLVYDAIKLYMHQMMLGKKSIKLNHINLSFWK